MYIRKKYRRLLAFGDKQFTIPPSFKRFMEEKQRFHNLVIKGKSGQCWCSYCNHYFVSQSKVNTVTKCPNCKTKLLVKTDRLQYYSFKDNLQLLDKIEDKYILRTFELYTSYNKRTVKHHLTEFMRTIFDGNEIAEFVSNETTNHFGTIYVSHYRPCTAWRKRNYRWAYRDVIGMVCPYNLKQLLKDTTLQYSQLDKFMAKQEYIDFVKYFTRIANYPTFEILVKMKLFNLAKDADEFYKGKNFQEVFGISKSFYPFMKKHNITYEQLKVLRLLQKQDIRLINKLVRFRHIRELSTYVDIEQAYYRVLRYNKHNESEYIDYLEACDKLRYDMNDKNILYPYNLMESHDKVMDLVEIVKNEENDKLIKQRLEILNKNIYQDEKYVVYPAPSIKSLIEESKQLSHCVKQYSQRYATAETDIYFLREISNKEKSLVTIEVKGNSIIQARIKHNGIPNDEQQKFIDLWKTKILDKAVA